MQAIRFVNRAAVMAAIVHWCSIGVKMQDSAVFGLTPERRRSKTPPPEDRQSITAVGSGNFDRMVGWQMSTTLIKGNGKVGPPNPPDYPKTRNTVT